MLEAAKKLGRLLLPPIISRPLGQALRSRELPVFEVVPEGWSRVAGDGNSLGWNRDVIIASERKRWRAFSDNVAGLGPLGFSHETDNSTITRNIAFHNIHLTYAYVLALVAHQKLTLSVLDWGGGLGHYYLIGKAMLPDVQFDYWCHEVPLMCQEGAQLCPEVHFCSDENCLQRTYDLVALNGSLGYFPDWKSTLAKLCETTERYLLVNRVFVVDHEPTFVVLHRTHEHGYQAEMLTQVFNRDELLQVMAERGFQVVREFAVEDPPFISGAAEQCVHTGWLFRKG